MAWRVHQVKLVNVTRLACAATSGAEGHLAQAPDFTHRVGCVVGCDDIDVVVGLVGVAQQALGREFLLDQLDGDGINNRFHRLC